MSVRWTLLSDTIRDGLGSSSSTGRNVHPAMAAIADPEGVSAVWRPVSSSWRKVPVLRVKKSFPSFAGSLEFATTGSLPNPRDVPQVRIGVRDRVLRRQ